MGSSLEAKVMDQFSSFLGNELTERKERYAGVIEEFGIADLEDSGVSKISLNGMTAEAKKLLQEFKVELPLTSQFKHVVVKELGQIQYAQGQKNMEIAGRAKTALHMAHVLAAFDEDIMLSAVSNEGIPGQLQTDFVISFENADPETVCSMINGVYGQAKIVETENLLEYPYQGHAVGSVFYPGKDTKKETINFEKMESWISAVLTALPLDRNYTVSIRCYPLSGGNRIQIEQHLKELAECYNKLKFYSELNWSNSSMLGCSRSKIENMIERKRSNMLGDIKAGENCSYSMALSGNDVDKQAQQMMEEMEYEMGRLSLLLDSASFGVHITISAESTNTFQVIASLLTGTLQYHNFRISWEEGKGNMASLVLGRQELLPFLFFPTREFCGFSFAENEEFSLVSQSTEEEGFLIGNILWNGKVIAPFYLSADAFARHAFICGMTGGGKTNTLFNLLTGMNLPFCVIEPVKGEYRALMNVFSDFKIYTMKTDMGTGDGMEIMRINPFWFPQGASLAYHIDSIRTIIASAFELSEAMPNILEQCLYHVYINAGWDIVQNRNIYEEILPEEYLYPTFEELCVEIERYLDQSDYSEEVKGNYKGALLSRVKSFVSGYKGLLLNTNTHPNYADLMNGHCVIELDGLADDADKCLVMGTVLIQYYQYLKLHFGSKKEKQAVQHLIVIEEAHRLFKNNIKNKKTDGSDAIGQLVDLLSNMMAEIRAFKEGMLIVDQSPEKIAEDVIKNSSSKICHRIDHEKDIKVMQSSILLKDSGQSFAALRQGEALIRTDGMIKPCKVKISLASVKEGYALASSFAARQNRRNILSDVFLANTIWRDEMVYEEICNQLMGYMDNLLDQGCIQWKELTDELMRRIIGILEKWKKYDAVEYINVLYELILQVIKRRASVLNRRESGMLHLFVSRILMLYQEQREGAKIKENEVVLLQRYMDANIREIFCTQNREGV